MKLFVLAIYAVSMFASPASAATQYVTGKVVQTQGHTIPACRTVQIRNATDGSIVYFRIPNTGQDNSILAITMTALTAGLQVIVAYDPAVTSGCGTEPQINWIGLLSNN